VKKLIVHDYDLQRWALNKQKEIQIEGFKASHNWVWKFKNANRIVSRKVTKIVTESYSKERSNINTTAELFVRSCENYFEDYLPSQIFNSDQSGFNYEIHSGRTLDFVGVKSVEGVVQSISSTTHSYTIQPTISADGDLLSPLFVVLQEPDGKFGPRVEENLFQAPNIYVTASRSGKLTKEHLIEWFKNVYFANTPDKSILLVDSWTTYNDKNAIEGVKPAEKKFDILKIR
jgi:hypothetical protein